MTNVYKHLQNETRVLNNDESFLNNKKVHTALI